MTKPLPDWSDPEMREAAETFLDLNDADGRETALVMEHFTAQVLRDRDARLRDPNVVMAEIRSGRIALPSVVQVAAEHGVASLERWIAGGRHMESRDPVEALVEAAERCGLVSLREAAAAVRAAMRMPAAEPCPAYEAGVG